MAGEVFRTSYKFGKTLRSKPAKTHRGGPDLKARLAAEAGPIKVPALTVGPPLSNTTTQTIPVPFVKSIDIDVVFDIVDYNWKADGGNANNGVVTLGIVTELQFVVLGKNLDIQLAAPLKISTTLTDGTAASDAMRSAADQAPVLAGLDLLQRVSA